jgi:ethanolamine ammonia-lyase small subunit
LVSQTKYFNSFPLISTGKNVHTCASNIHQDGDPRKAAAKGTLPERDPIKKAKSGKTCKKESHVE